MKGHFNCLLVAPAKECVASESRVLTRFKEGDLNVGENSCVDRCASKYWQVTGIVGQMLGGQGGMQ